MASLSEEFARLANPTPVFKDPEDDSDDETKARVVQGESENIEVQPSSLRRKTATVLADIDKKYAGKRTSRKDLDSDEFEVDDESESDYGERCDLSDDDVDEHEDDDSSDNEDDDEEEDIADFQRQISLNTSQSKKEFSFVDDGDYSKYGEDSEDSSDNEEDESGEEGHEEEEGEDEEEEADEMQEKGSTTGETIQPFSTTAADEVAKGHATKQQLGLWDSLLEGRIKLQKAVSVMNHLPQTNTWSVFQSKAESFQNEARNTQKALKTLLDNLIYLQDLLLLQNQETAHMVNGSSQRSSNDDEEIPSDTDDEEAKTKPVAAKAVKRKKKMTDYPGFLAKRHTDFQAFRDSTIQKWNDKTRLAGGNLKGKSFSAFDHSALSQINNILSDKERLIKRTQLKRSVYKVLGKPTKAGDPEILENTEERLKSNDNLKDYDDEIFDDDDFYHQLLRELIEKKTANTNDPVALSRQWLQIQKLRKKTKKKVDTQASKGRKTRFDVHKKLVNFMAPDEHTSWSDEAKDDLFKSLFGKRFCSNMTTASEL